MFSGTRSIAFLVMATGLLLVPIGPGLGADPPAPLRIGTFDSRFVALAYYRSEAGQQLARDLGKQLEAARAADDQAKLRELEMAGPALQNLMHQQVFGNLSIPNVLKTVATGLPGVAEKAGVSLLVSKWEVQYRGPGIETVDLTLQLIELFEIDDSTRTMIEAGMKSASDPVPVEQLLNPLE